MGRIALSDLYVSEITGVIPLPGQVLRLSCGEDRRSLMQRIRYLDKLVDELAKGKAMDKILRK